MPLVSCPICTRPVSCDTPACPGCGHPVAAPKAPKESIKPVVINRGTSSLAILLGLLLLLGFVAAFSKPKESELRSGLVENYGLLYGAGVVAETLGVVQMNYNDYVVLSTMSVRIGTEPERTMATGVFGQVILPDSQEMSNLRSRPASYTPATGSIEPAPVSDTDPASNSSQTATAMPVDAPPVESRRLEQPYANTNIQPPAYTPQQMAQGLASARQLLLNEMSSTAGNLLQSRHPLSRIEHCEQPTTNYYKQSLYGEDIVSVFACRMRGTVTGATVFHLVVRVHAEIRFENGTFVRRIKGTDVPVDSRG